mmetsp:Transcript_89368/g.255178  ORF Transcript_89368/g.255178 Transcript_89368/m.255178 type:complete len:384 (+) Transcript_89368:1032-2183(+)
MSLLQLTGARGGEGRDEAAGAAAHATVARGGDQRDATGTSFLEFRRAAVRIVRGHANLLVAVRDGEEGRRLVVIGERGEPLHERLVLRIVRGPSGRGPVLGDDLIAGGRDPLDVERRLVARRFVGLILRDVGESRKVVRKRDAVFLAEGLEVLHVVILSQERSHALLQSRGIARATVGLGQVVHRAQHRRANERVVVITELHLLQILLGRRVGVRGEGREGKRRRDEVDMLRNLLRHRVLRVSTDTHDCLAGVGVGVGPVLRADQGLGLRHGDGGADKVRVGRGGDIRRTVQPLHDMAHRVSRRLDQLVHLRVREEVAVLGGARGGHGVKHAVQLVFVLLFDRHRDPDLLRGVSPGSRRPALDLGGAGEVVLGFLELFDWHTR